MQKKIYIFRGSPASGKGTITEEFIKQLDGKIAFLELDNFRWGFHLKNRVVADIGQKEHLLAYKNFLSVLENYLSDGSYTLVIEGLFSWRVAGPHGNMQDIISLATKYNYNYYPILLYADFETLWNRNLQRDYSVPIDEFKQLYSYVMDAQSEEEIKINVDDKSVQESVDILSQYI
ncbi:hypothetical protein KC874_04585 [Candidatus Saccharibacteria bacterium]|nr:hypothetical protein [Candidatus Saccharibacteria bacterium]